MQAHADDEKPDENPAPRQYLSLKTQIRNCSLTTLGQIPSMVAPDTSFQKDARNCHAQQDPSITL